MKRNDKKNPYRTLGTEAVRAPMAPKDNPTATVKKNGADMRVGRGK